MTDRLLAVLDAVRHAPSLLNTQPWRFRLEERAGGPVLLLFADRDRQLTALDPEGRELTISCGAALAVLRVAALHHGLRAHVDPFPEPASADLLALVTVSEEAAPPAEERLFRAIATRRTHRGEIAPDPIPAAVAAALVGAAAQDGAWLRLLTDPAEKATVARVTGAAVEAQGQRREVVAELTDWLRPDGDPRPDGVRDGDQGRWDRRSDVRTPPGAVAQHKAALLRAAPAVGLLGTEGDGPRAWLVAGMALGEVLLEAADRGLAVSYANEAVEVGGPYRRRLAALVGGGAPQMVFRIGRPVLEGRTPRRPLDDVVEVVSAAAPEPTDSSSAGPVEARSSRPSSGRIPRSR